MTNDIDKKRDEQLEESMLQRRGKYHFYSVGRTRLLKRLGNPFFGGEPEDIDEWDMDRKLGVAWVVFTQPESRLDAILASNDPLSSIDAIWQSEMHYKEQESIYEYIVKEAGLVEASQTEVVKDSRGKQEAG